MVAKRFRVLLVLLAVACAVPGIALAQAVPDQTTPFFDDTVLQEIRLSINHRDWESLKEHFQENTYYPADFRWGNQVVRYIGIRSRGSGSRRPNKPSLRLDFNRYTSGQTFLGLKSVVVRNNSQDATNLRERLSMLFFRRMGLPAEREAHTRLYVNDEYAGLFTIVESPDKDYLQRNLGENDGRLYKYAFDNEAVLAGAKPFVFQYLGSDPSLYVPVPFEPETNTDDPQGEVIARFVRTINDTAAAGWRTAMAEFLDLSKFIRGLAVENYLAEEDGHTGDYGPNNFYLYRFKNTNRFQFLPWDKSNTFWEGPNYSIFRNITDGPEDHRNRLVLRAFQEPDLLKLYLDTLIECADSASSVAGALPTDPPFAQGWLEREVQREYDQVHAAALEDTFNFSNGAFEQAIVDVKAFARDRSDAVRQQVAARR